MKTMIIAYRVGSFTSKINVSTEVVDKLAATLGGAQVDAVSWLSRAASEAKQSGVSNVGELVREKAKAVIDA